jgi:hypothetical protein
VKRNVMVGGPKALVALSFVRLDEEVRDFGHFSSDGYTAYLPQNGAQ